MAARPPPKLHSIKSVLGNYVVACLRPNITCVSALDSTPTEAVMVRYPQWSRALALAALVVGSPTALAHDWYPSACCSDRDCHALAEDKGETVTETAQGWKLWDGRIITRGLAQLSPDQRFHLCESPAKGIICFFAPPGGS